MYETSILEIREVDMGWHDSLAAKAVMMGKTETEFRKAAQSNANATWVLLVVAGIVWYFVGLEWALVPAGLAAFVAFKSISASMVANRLGNGDPKQPQSLEPDTEVIIQAYGKLLEHNAPAPGTVADASQLPYSKYQIKYSILQALENSNDEKMKENLRIAYVTLADWQEGVGDKNLGLDTSNLDLTQDTQELAKQVLASHSASSGILDQANREREMLLEDLRTLKN